MGEVKQTAHLGSDWRCGLGKVMLAEVMGCDLSMRLCTLPY